MSGHSRWANIKHKKARSDAKKGKLFTKLVKEIMVAAKLGGPDPSGNTRLRTAVENAREENLPADNIEKAIKKGAGGESGVNYEEGVYEGYGPGGVAVLAGYMTDNKNRTAALVRGVFTKFGGTLAASGAVRWLFEKKGFFSFDVKSIEEDKLMDAALECGAEDVKRNDEDGVYEVYTQPGDFCKVKTSFESLGMKYTMAELSMIPKTTVHVEGHIARRVLAFMEALDDLDDVQTVFANFDMSKEDIEEVA